MKVFYLLTFSYLSSALKSGYIEYFTNQNPNHDGTLTRAQFLNGLVELFKNLELHGTASEWRDFGNTFLDNKIIKQSVQLDLIQGWVKENNLVMAYNSWTHLLFNSPFRRKEPPAPTEDPSEPVKPPFPHMSIPKSESSPPKDPKQRKEPKKPLKNKLEDF